MTPKRTNLLLLAKQLREDKWLSEYPDIQREVVGYCRHLGAYRLRGDLESPLVGLALCKLELLIYIVSNKHQTANGPATLTRVLEQIGKLTRLLAAAGVRLDRPAPPRTRRPAFRVVAAEIDRMDDDAFYQICAACDRRLVREHAENGDDDAPDASGEQINEAGDPADDKDEGEPAA